MTNSLISRSKTKILSVLSLSLLSLFIGAFACFVLLSPGQHAELKKTPLTLDDHLAFLMQRHTGGRILLTTVQSFEPAENGAIIHAADRSTMSPFWVVKFKIDKAVRGSIPVEELNYLTHSPFVDMGISDEGEKFVMIVNGPFQQLPQVLSNKRVHFRFPLGCYRISAAYKVESTEGNVIIRSMLIR